MLDMDTLAVLSLIDILLSQDQEKKLIRLQIRLNFTILLLMIGSKCHRLKKVDTIIQVATLTINLFMFLVVSKPQTRNILALLKELILI
jgi:hypothetical protein